VFRVERVKHRYQRSLRLVMVILGLQLSAFGLGQSLSFGLYGRLSPDHLTPTLEATLPLGSFDLHTRFQQGALGVGLGSTMGFGTLGQVSYGVLASLGFAGWGLQGSARGTFGPVAASLEALYSNTLRSNLWVGDQAEGGLKLGVAGRYRLAPRQTLGLQLGFSRDLLGTPRGSGELTYALRQSQTYTFGLGVDDSRLYGLLGWRGEIDAAGTILTTTLRAGQLNRLEAALTAPLDPEQFNNLKLHLTLAYPWTASLGVEAHGFRADAAYDGGFSLWLRYRLISGGNE
jgi:hypothetical protein